MRYFSLSGLALLLLAGLLHQKPFEVTPIFYGHVMRIGEGETFVAPDSPNGLSMDTDWDIIEADTWTVPNCLKHGLGLELIIDNIPDGVETLKVTIDFPPMTLPSGEINSHLERDEDLIIFDGTGYFDFYYFWDEEYERGLGDWRIRIYHEDKLLYDQAFKVVACEADSP